MPRPSCADATSPREDAPPHRPRWDRPDLYDDARAEIATQAELVATYADTLRMLVGVRDDAGTLYATRKMLAHMRLMTAGVKLLPAAERATTAPASAASPPARVTRGTQGRDKRPR